MQDARLGNFRPMIHANADPPPQNLPLGFRVLQRHSIRTFLDSAWSRWSTFGPQGVMTSKE